MAAPSQDTSVEEMVTVRCPNHHQRLSAGLWSFLQAEHAVDMDVQWAGQSLRAHRLVLDVFLSADKLMSSVASSNPTVVLQSTDQEPEGQQEDVVAVRQLKDQHDGCLDSFLEFVYRGKINVPRYRLASLLEAARASDFQALVEALQQTTAQGDVELDGSVAVKPRTTSRRRADAAKSAGSAQKKADGRSNAAFLVDTSEGHDVMTFEEVVEGGLGSGVAASDEKPKRKRIRPSHPTDKRHKCPICPKAFNRPDGLKIHSRQHTGERPFTCEHCQKSFVRVEQLRIHQRLHTGDKPFKCQMCERAFFTRQRLVVHARVHTGEKPYKCLECGKQYLESSALNVHKRNSHSGERPHACLVCKKAFTDRTKLKIHFRQHTGERPYACNICNKSFSTPRNLRCHSRTHSGEKPYRCDECGRCFSQSNRLKSHILTHTGERPYVCEECGRAFAQSSALAGHRETHNPHRPKNFVCAVCQKAFATKQRLESHVQTHADEKRFTCHICGKAFITNATLRQHAFTHTGSRPYQCDVCSKSFSRNESLKRHLQMHADQDAKPDTCIINIY